MSKSPKGFWKGLTQNAASRSQAFLWNSGVTCKLFFLCSVLCFAFFFFSPLLMVRPCLQTPYSSLFVDTQKRLVGSQEG